MATRAILLPYAAEFPSTNFPQLGTTHSTARRPVLGFDATTEEACYWTLAAPSGITGTMTAVITYIMASATSGGVAFGVSVEAVSDGDTTDLDAAESLDTENVATAASVPGTAGHIDQIAVTLTNQDSIAAADLVRIKLARKVGNAADTATGDAQVLAVELRDAA